MSLFRLFRLCFYALFLLACAVGYYVYIETITKPLQNRDYHLVVPKGVGVSWLANHLESNNIIDNKYVFRAYVWINKRNLSIKAGEYTLVDIDNVPDLIAKVEQGNVINYVITFIEGKTFKEYLAQLAGNSILEKELTDMSSAQIMRALGSPGKHPEGMFAPETYFYQKGDSDLDILRQAHERLNQVLEAAWAGRDTKINTYTRYGLPPTPIAMAGEASILAAAKPETTKSLYFVGKGDGSHYFSKNLKEHNNAVIKYQLGGKPKAFSSNPQ